jgi:uncharacterized protein YbjT (DUF2867 family)
MKRILVTGGTGFTGSRVVPLLIQQGYRVRCFIRPTSDRARLQNHDVEWAEGDLGDVASLRDAMRGVEVLANIASIGFGHAPDIVNAAADAGIRRAVFISTTALFTTLNAPSRKLRLAAEETIRESPLRYTLLRPTMIYGSAGDRNMCRLIKTLQKYPVFPILGDGESLQQPVYVEDVARAVVCVLGSEETIGKAYNIPGPEPLTMNQVVDTICALRKRRVRKIHLPAGLFVRGLRMMEGAGLRLPVKSEQILRLNEDKVFSYEAAARDFGYAPMGFEEGIGREIAGMRA